MSGGTSQYEQQARLNVFKGSAYPAPATVYLALFTTLPAADGSGGVESVDTTYARLAITANVANFPSATGGGPASMSNGVAFNMFVATGNDAATVKGWGFFDALAAGNLLRWGPVSVPAALGVGAVATFAIGAITLTAV
jgi:hypothetical protein